MGSEIRSHTMHTTWSLIPIPILMLNKTWTAISMANLFFSTHYFDGGNKSWKIGEGFPPQAFAMIKMIDYLFLIRIACVKCKEIERKYRAMLAHRKTRRKITTSPDEDDWNARLTLPQPTTPELWLLKMQWQKANYKFGQGFPPLACSNEWRINMHQDKHVKIKTSVTSRRKIVARIRQTEIKNGLSIKDTWK